MAGSPSSKAARRNLNNDLFSEPHGAVAVDIGDFNEKLESVADRIAFFPQLSTYRLDPRSVTNKWISTIDGCMLSPLLARGASVARLKPTEGIQHAPVAVNLDLCADFHQQLNWTIPTPIELEWTASAHLAFNALQRNVANLCARNTVVRTNGGLAPNDDLRLATDKIWDYWVNHVGCLNPVLQKGPPTGGFSTNTRLEPYWRKLRRFAALGTAAADDAAAEVYDAIQQAINYVNRKRLETLRKAMNTRRGAATYIKQRMARRKRPTLMPYDTATFTSNEAAEHVGPDFARRWNVGLFSCLSAGPVGCNFSNSLQRRTA